MQRELYINTPPHKSLKIIQTTSTVYGNLIMATAGRNM
jgi:hypothetical protein